MPSTLPLRANLEHLRKQAKDLLRAHQLGDATVCPALRHLRHLAQATDEEILGAPLALRQAQHALAKQYGFTNWAALKAAVEAAKAHADHGSEADAGGLPWQRALRTVLQLAYDTVEKEGIAWTMIDRSAASLQGARITPRPEDGGCIITQQPASVFRFAELLLPITPEGDAAAPPTEPCRSTRRHPVFVGPDIGLDWHWASWTIDTLGFVVTHVVAPDGHPNNRNGGLWECDPSIWPHVRRVPFEEYSVPVVPLEILAAHWLAGGHGEAREDLFYYVAEIARLFRANAYDQSLLEWAMRPHLLTRFEAIMQTQ